MHIGVIEYIQEHNVEVTELSGTSIGALIASMYAIWMSADDMKETFSDINFRMFFDAEIGDWLFGWKKIYKRLDSIFWEKMIQNAEIPCSIIAANVHTGEEKVFTQWLFTDAIRASISLPGLVTPHKINDTLYIDGWVVNNLPIDTLSTDKVIASSCADTIYDALEERKKFLGITLPSSAVKNVSKILNNSIQIMLKRIEDLTIQQTEKELILIRPDLQDFTMFDIKKLDNIIRLGYESAKNKVS